VGIEKLEDVEKLKNMQVSIQKVSLSRDKEDA